MTIDELALQKPVIQKTSGPRAFLWRVTRTVPPQIRVHHPCTYAHSRDRRQRTPKLPPPKIVSVLFSGWGIPAICCDLRTSNNTLSTVLHEVHCPARAPTADKVRHAEPDVGVDCRPRPSIAPSGLFLIPPCRFRTLRKCGALI
jgi:hypothetical protein